MGSRLFVIYITVLFLRTGMTTADEMLYPEKSSLVDDLISYMAVGARSVEGPTTPF